MIIVRLKGGLGNQMFQYSFAKLLEKKTGEQVKLDFSAYQGYELDAIRSPRIKRFQLSLDEATESDLKNICIFKHGGFSRSISYRGSLFLESLLNADYYREKNRGILDVDALVEKNYKYYDGYWQSYKYVDAVLDVVQRDFVSQNEISENTKKQIEDYASLNTVFVGVRKGDYTKTKHGRDHFGSFSSKYYEQAMAYISKNVKDPLFLIFSNDIQWCKENLKLNGYNFQYREKENQTDDFEEFILMTQCKHAIIVNSTYHWWAAKLIGNPKKIVCCPKHWFFDDAPIDILPGDWIKFDANNEP